MKRTILILVLAASSAGAADLRHRLMSKGWRRAATVSAAGKIIIAKLSAVFYPVCMAKDKPESRINFPAPRKLRKRLNDYAAQHNTHRNVLLVRFMRAIVGSGKNPDDYFKE
jgi:hypothetical protein